MASQKHVYELATGRFVQGGPFDPPWDPATQAILELPIDAPRPDYVTQRCVAGALRDATPAEMAAEDEAARAGVFEAKDELRALARETYACLPLDRRPATFAEFWTNIKTRFAKRTLT